MDDKICFTQMFLGVNGENFGVPVSHKFLQDKNAFVLDKNGMREFPERLYCKRVCKRCGYTSFIDPKKNHGFKSERRF
jgi:hypothetical protein